MGQGIDYRLLTKEIAKLLSKNRFGLINNKGNWYKGIRISWDWGKEQEKDCLNAIKLLENAGYYRNHIMVFVLTNWKIPLNICMYKLNKFKEWKVKIDDCTYNCSKKLFIPLYWKEKDYRKFRSLCRKHNQIIGFRGHDPESKKKFKN